MSIASSEIHEGGQVVTAASETESAATQPTKRTRRRKSTSHLKSVPETLAERERIKGEAERFVTGLDKSKPFNRDQLETWARELLGQLDLSEKFVGFAAVLIGNFFWKRQFVAIPFERRSMRSTRTLRSLTRERRTICRRSSTARRCQRQAPRTLPNRGTSARIRKLSRWRSGDESTSWKRF